MGRACLTHEDGEGRPRALSGPAVALLKVLPRMAGCDIVFPSSRNGPLSDATLSSTLKRMGVNAVPHGFRSTFRDWCSERTNYPRDAAEMALAHAIGDKVEAAYRRGDLFEKRVAMMSEWADFIGGSCQDRCRQELSSQAAFLR